MTTTPPRKPKDFPEFVALFRLSAAAAVIPAVLLMVWGDDGAGLFPICFGPPAVFFGLCILIARLVRRVDGGWPGSARETPSTSPRPARAAPGETLANLRPCRAPPGAARCEPLRCSEAFCGPTPATPLLTRQTVGKRHDEAVAHPLRR